MLNLEMFGDLFMALEYSNGRQPDGKMMQVWYNLLKEYPEEKIIKAIKKMTVSSDDFPTIGKIIALCSESTDYHAKAIEAWSKVLDSASCGNEPEDPLIAECVRAVGGGYAIGYMEYGSYEMGSAERRFIELYESKLEEASKLDMPMIGEVKRDQIAQEAGK